MKSNFKRLGDYIEPVDEFNTGWKIELLLGINNIKYFQKSQTNTIGVDLSKYRVVRTNQFAFNRATTRNGDKLSIALRRGPDCIVSPSYRVFRSKDENKLNSEYLMMWFRRPDFDRYARFRSHGSAHEFFDLDEMYEVRLPIPPIEKQREIVAEYHTIQNRITLNNQLIQTLETAAQAIYKKWFVEFEFPNEAGQPYKSSGGELVDSDLGNIPRGWSAGTLFDATSYLNRGVTPVYTDGEGVMVINQKCVRNNSLDFSFTRNHALEMKAIAKDKFLRHFDVLVNSTGEGTLGRVGLVKEKPKPMTVDTHVTIVRPSEDIVPLYLWYSISSRTEEIEKLAEGSTGQTELGRANLGSLPMLLPTEEVQQKFELCMSALVSHSSKVEQEASILLNLSSLLLSKLATIESPTPTPAAPKPAQLTLAFA